MGAIFLHKIIIYLVFAFVVLLVLLIYLLLIFCCIDLLSNLLSVIDPRERERGSENV